MSTRDVTADAAGSSRTIAVAAEGRYNATAQALHWVTALLMFIAIPLAWVMTAMPKSASSREFYFTLHKSVGLTVLVLVAVRLAWRATHPAPPSPSSLARWEWLAGRASHWLLYLILVGMPVSGYVMSAAGSHPVTYFGLFTLPGLPRDPAIAGAGYWIHVVTGQWAVYALIALHLLATAWHVAVRRDGVLGRMLPPETGSA